MADGAGLAKEAVSKVLPDTRTLVSCRTLVLDHQFLRTTAPGRKREGERLRHSVPRHR